MGAVLARKAVLWVLQDGAVVWNGLVLDWQHQSILDGTLPLNCADLSYILSKRVINTTLTYTSEDIFDIARNLVGYALGKSPNGIIANLTFSGGQCGISDSMTFASSQRQDVLSSAEHAGQHVQHRVGFPAVPGRRRQLSTHRSTWAFRRSGWRSRRASSSTSSPATCWTTRSWPWGPRRANRVLTTAQNTDNSGDTLTGRATDNLRPGPGLPAVRAPDHRINGDLDEQRPGRGVRHRLPAVRSPTRSSRPLLTLPGGQYPTVSQTVLGSYAQVSLTSWLHPAKEDGAPGFTGIGRVVGWTLTPSSAQQAENTQVQLGQMTMTGDPGNIGIST